MSRTSFRNIFRVAFLLSCHIFDCYGISDACLAGDPSCFRSVFLRSNSDIVYQSAVNVKHFLRFLQSFQLGVSDQVASRSAASAILTLLIMLCKHFFKEMFISYYMYGFTCLNRLFHVIRVFF